MCNRADAENTSNREEAVMRMQLTLIPILLKSWKISLEELMKLFIKYDILSYIDTCYEAFNSTGNQGIIEELEEYIAIQGGTIR